jgi:DNA-binding FadR family transcriptional regulator
MSKHEEIVATLTREILVGQYRVGERLPSERDLAARFEANRGAVREAMKKLEQLGIADIQPGGARVVPLNEASLDVIGFLLELEEVPNRILLDQIFVVINSLVQTAAISAVARLDDADLDKLRGLCRAIWAERLDVEAHLEARLNMFRGVMAASGNLPVQLIAKALLQQVSPQMESLKGYLDPNLDTQSALARKIDDALASRDPGLIRKSYNELFDSHRAQMTQAFDAFEAAQQSTVGLEAFAS